MGVAPRPETITVFGEERFKYWLQYLDYSLLYHAVYDRWYAQGSLPSVRFWYFYSPYRFWFIPSASNTFQQFVFV